MFAHRGTGFPHASRFEGVEHLSMFGAVVGLSYREAARTLGVRTATITTRLHRARQRVAHALLADDEATRQLMTRPKR
jgi:predicted DNA-binding protein (UPF0251 family)